MVSSPYAILTLLNDVSYSMYKERIVIGRGTPGAPVDLHVGESTFISRRHLELVWKSNTLRLTCNGKNGIFVDKDFRPNDPVARPLPACCVLRFPSTSICIRIEQCRLRSSRRSSVLRRRRRPLGDHQTTSESENSGSNDESDESPSPAKKSKNNSATDSLCCEVQETADHISSVSNCLTSKSGTRRKQALVPSKPSLAPQISDEPACMNEHSTNIEKPMIDPSTPSKPPTQEVTNVAQTAFTLSSLSFPVSVNTSCTAVLNHLTPTVLGVSSLTHVERGDKTHKPPYSYAQLIAQAIASRPDRQVTLSGIYSYISQNYPYYQAQDKGWQNSVRHNLSLNRYFLKVPRTQDDHGKGCFWRIDPTVESKMVALAFRKRRSRAYSSVVFTPSLMSGVQLAPLERAHSVSAASPYGYTPLRTLASKVVVVGGNRQDAGGEAGIVGFIPNSTIHVASVAGSTQTLSPKSQWTGPTQEVIPVVTSNSQVLRPKRIIVCYPNTNRQ